MNYEKNIIYKIDDVLGEDEIKTNGYINLEYSKEQDYIKAKNLYEQDVNEIAYVYSSEPIKAFTGNNNKINLYSKESLNNENSLGNNACIAIETEVELKELEEKEIIFVFGETEENIDTKFRNISKCKEELLNTKNYWSELLEKIRVKTPIESLNIMLNGWAMYQTIASRIFAKSRILPIRRCLRL